MIRCIYSIESQGEQVGVAIEFTDGSVSVRRADLDMLLQYETMNDVIVDLGLQDVLVELQTATPLDSAVVKRAIDDVCADMAMFLKAKNDAYGNSALEPINVFYKGSPQDGICIRIDDKLKRLRNGYGYHGDNDLKDLTGYLLLLMVSKKLGLPVPIDIERSKL